jgi:hypothetical protein
MPKFARFFSCVPNKKSTISIYICLELRNKQQEQTPKKCKNHKKISFPCLFILNPFQQLFVSALKRLIINEIRLVIAIRNSYIMAWTRFIIMYFNLTSLQLK